jgi:hypothetical protein
MAVSYVWPGSLPENPLTQYADDGGVLLARTPMDKGPAKMRRLGQRPAKMMLSWGMTSEQVTTFETFVLDTLKGTARFGFNHPRKGGQIEARFIPDEDGKLYDIAHNGPELWIVSAEIEVLP